MWLITGGAYQGKLEYALEQTNGNPVKIINGEDANLEKLRNASIVNQFHLWIKRMLMSGEDIYGILDQILHDNPEIIIVMNELGCGIVPMNPFDREYRETVGRVSCYLAKQAVQVHLVSCGIGMVIKNA